MKYEVFFNLSKVIEQNFGLSVHANKLMSNTNQMIYWIDEEQTDDKAVSISIKRDDMAFITTIRINREKLPYVTLDRVRSWNEQYKNSLAESINKSVQEIYTHMRNHAANEKLSFNTESDKENIRFTTEFFELIITKNTNNGQINLKVYQRYLMNVDTIIDYDFNIVNSKNRQPLLIMTEMCLNIISKLQKEISASELRKQ